jgi:hypothetical protein
MEKLNESIDWNRINAFLLSHHNVGASSAGAGAYPPLLLYRSLLLQKWFHIVSDPELEDHINNHLSFKKYLVLSFSKFSPDHSTLSRFRARLSNKAMDKINPEILHKFKSQGLTINEGIVSMPNSLNPVFGRVAKTKSCRPEISIICMKANFIKTASGLNSIAIWILIRLFKKICLVIGSKSMPALIPNTDLFRSLTRRKLRSTIPIISNIVRFSVNISNKKSKKYMRTKFTPENPTATSWLLTKSMTGL